MRDDNFGQMAAQFRLEAFLLSAERSQRAAVAPGEHSPSSVLKKGVQARPYGFRDFYAVPVEHERRAKWPVLLPIER